MSATVAPVPDDVYAALGDFIASTLNIPKASIVRGLVNRVPMPVPAPGFVTMTALFQDRLATNEDSYDIVGDLRSIKKSTRIDIQVDFYGPNSAMWANIVSTLFRDPFGCDALAPNCQPLYADDATLVPFIDGEQQYEERWLLTAALQYNPVVTIGQQFADTAVVGVIDVEEAYVPIPPVLHWRADSDTITADSGTVTADDP